MRPSWSGRCGVEGGTRILSRQNQYAHNPSRMPRLDLTRLVSSRVVHLLTKPVAGQGIRIEQSTSFLVHFFSLKTECKQNLFHLLGN